MKKRLLIALSVLLLVMLSAVLLYTRTPVESTPSQKPYVGVAFGGNTVEEAKALIDRTRNYTNLFILQSGPISTNETATTEICNYATTSGQSIIVYFGDLAPNILAEKGLSWRTTWVTNAKTTYGSNFWVFITMTSPVEYTLTLTKALLRAGLCLKMQLMTQ